jgi:hypothetical protein
VTDDAAAKEQPVPSDDHTSVSGLVAWERWIAGLIGLGAAGAGGVSVFMSDNQAGSTALLVFGAIFMLLAVQGTAIRRATRESVELERRSAVRKVVNEARERIDAGEPDVAQAYIEGAADTDPAVATDAAIRDVAADAYVQRVGQAISRVVNASASYEVSLSRDYADARIRDRRDPNGPVIEVYCKHLQLPRARAISARWLRGVFDRFRRAGPTLIVSNYPLSAGAAQWLDAQAEYPHVHFTPWGDTEDDENLAHAIDILFAEAAERGRHQ